MRAYHELPVLPSCESGRGQFLSALWHETAQSVPAVPECLAARRQVLHGLWPRPDGCVLPPVTSCLRLLSAGGTTGERGRPGSLVGSAAGGYQCAGGRTPTVDRAVLQP